MCGRIVYIIMQISWVVIALQFKQFLHISMMRVFYPLIYVMHKDSAFISQRTQCGSIRKTSQWMPYRENIDVYCENNRKLTHSLCESNVEFFRRSLWIKKRRAYVEITSVCLWPNVSDWNFCRIFMKFRIGTHYRMLRSSVIFVKIVVVTYILHARA